MIEGDHSRTSFGPSCHGNRWNPGLIMSSCANAISNTLKLQLAHQSMAAADPPSFVGSKRKLRSETNENIPAKRREVASPKDTRIALPRPRLAPPAAQFVPYRQGTVRHLRLDDHHFLAAKSHVEALIAYKYKRQELLLEALYPLKNEWARAALGPILREANYRLALIGDAVLKMAILDARYNLSELNGIFYTGSLCNAPC